ncbi:hypothetical protein Hte_004458 [Hypoxylon texense]
MSWSAPGPAGPTGTGSGGKYDPHMSFESNTFGRRGATPHAVHASSSVGQNFYGYSYGPLPQAPLTQPQIWTQQMPIASSPAIHRYPPQQIPTTDPSLTHHHPYQQMCMCNGNLQILEQLASTGHIVFRPQICPTPPIVHACPYPPTHQSMSPTVYPIPQYYTDTGHADAGAYEVLPIPEVNHCSSFNPDFITANPTPYATPTSLIAPGAGSSSVAVPTTTAQATKLEAGSQEPQVSTKSRIVSGGGKKIASRQLDKANDNQKHDRPCLRCQISKLSCDLGRPCDSCKKRWGETDTSRLCSPWEYVFDVRQRITGLYRLVPPLDQIPPFKGHGTVQTLNLTHPPQTIGDSYICFLDAPNLELKCRYIKELGTYVLVELPSEKDLVKWGSFDIEDKHIIAPGDVESALTAFLSEYVKGSVPSEDRCLVRKVLDIAALGRVLDNRQPYISMRQPPQHGYVHPNSEEPYEWDESLVTGHPKAELSSFVLGKIKPLEEEVFKEFDFIKSQRSQKYGLITAFCIRLLGIIYRRNMQWYKGGRGEESKTYRENNHRMYETLTKHYFYLFTSKVMPFYKGSIENLHEDWLAGNGELEQMLEEVKTAELYHARCDLDDEDDFYYKKLCLEHIDQMQSSLAKVWKNRETPVFFNGSAGKRCQYKYSLYPIIPTAREWRCQALGLVTQAQPLPSGKYRSLHRSLIGRIEGLVACATMGIGGGGDCSLPDGSFV